MRGFPRKFRLPAAFAAVLAVGFALVIGVGYLGARDAARTNIATQLLPLTGDSLYSEIKNLLSRSTLASALLAQDAAVRATLATSDGSSERIAGAFKGLASKLGPVSGYVVSDRSRQYFLADGSVKFLQEADAHDKWFFKMRDAKDAVQIRADPDDGVIYVHHRIVDDAGNFVGVTGVALRLDGLLDRYQTRLQGRASLVNADGIAMVPAKASAQPRSIHERSGIRQIAAAILSQRTSQLEYQLDQAPTLVYSRLVPELGWRLVLERGVEPEMAALQPTLLWAAATGGAVTLLALALILFVEKRHRDQLARLASIDPLTGLMNRQAFEIVLRQSMRDFERNGRPMSAILFDIDGFKQINDRHGHEAGDQVLQAVANMAASVVRDNDIMTRWGGEEFLILLRDCELEVAARLGDKLRGVIASYDFNLPKQVTASVGVAQYLLQEPEARFFARANQARYEAKASGRNRTIVSVMEGQDAQDAVIVKRA